MIPTKETHKMRDSVFERYARLTEKETEDDKHLPQFYKAHMLESVVGFDHRKT